VFAALLGKKEPDVFWTLMNFCMQFATLTICHFGLIADFSSRRETFSGKMEVHFNDLGNDKLWQSAKGTVFVALKHLGIGG